MVASLGTNTDLVTLELSVHAMARRIVTGHLAKGCQAALRSNAGSQPVSANWRSAMTASSPAAYHGAQKVPVPHASLKTGDACPDGCGGKVYPQRDPGVLVRIKGQAPLAATVYELEKLRCNLCGNVYTAAAPAEAGEKKYDESAASMIAMLRYGSGFPWNRLEKLEDSLGIPLPAATQCEIMQRDPRGYPGPSRNDSGELFGIGGPNPQAYVRPCMERLRPARVSKL